MLTICYMLAGVNIKKRMLNIPRIIIKRDNKSIKTGTYILMVRKSFPPQNLKIGYLIVNVDVFIQIHFGVSNARSLVMIRMHVKTKSSVSSTARKVTTIPVVKTKQNVPIAWVTILPYPKTVLSGGKEMLIQQIKTEKWLSYPEA